MVHGAVRAFFHILGGIVIVLLLLLAAAAWRLGQGPVSLSGLTPYLEDALAVEDSPFRIRLGDSLLAWSGGSHPLSLRMTGIRAEDPQGNLVASLPEAAVELSPYWLIRGEVRLQSLDIIQPHLRLMRDQDGRVSLGVTPQAASNTEPQPSPEQATATSTSLLDSMLAALAGDTQRAGPLADLQRVRMINADAEIIDQQLHLTWNVPRASLNLRRDGPGLVALDAGVEVDLPPINSQAEPDKISLSLQGRYAQGPQTLSLSASFDGVQPSVFTSLVPDLAPLAGLELPLKGMVSVGLGIVQGGNLLLKDASLAIASADSGRITLPPELGAEYTVRSLDLSAHAVARQGNSLLSAPQDAQALEMAFLDHLTLVLQPPGGEPDATVSLKAQLTTHPPEGAKAAHLTADITAQTSLVPVAALASWWPRVVAPSPREWVTEHLKDGTATQGRWDVRLEGPSFAALEPTSLKGNLRAEGMTVDYLPPMPAVRNGTADVAFALDRLDVTVHSGTVEQDGKPPLVLESGTVALTGLNAPEQMTDIALAVSGPLQSALTLLDNKPLGYTSKLGLKPSQGSGTASTTLQMRFPPLADLKLDQIDVKAQATLSGVALAGAVFGQDLTNGNLTLEVDTKALNAKGQAALGGVPATFTWREVFSGRPYRSRYRARAMVEENKRGIFGLTFPPFTPRYVGGPATADIDFTIVSNTLSTLNAEVDLKAASLHIPGFDWHKEAGTPAQATVSVRMAGGSVREVPTFKVRSTDQLSLEGRVELDNSSGLKKIDLSHGQIATSVFTGTLEKQSNGDYLITARGPNFNLMPFMGRSAKKTSEGGGTMPPPPKPSATPDEPENLPPMTLKARFDRVWLAEDGSLSNVEAQARRVDGAWRWANVEGEVEKGSPFTYQLSPRTERGPLPAQRTFAVKTDNAGGLLRAMGMLGTMQGGSLLASGTVDPQGTATGLLTIDEYRLVDAPILARILSVAALTGILDSLSGEGIGFDHLKAPFTLSDELLLLRDFQTSGDALGLTGSGRVNRIKDEIDIAGTIVPAYALNSLLGKIPLVGGLLSGFTEGGGLIAATYTMKGQVEEPQISVNPLSAFAPGFLKNLFGMGEPDQPVPE